MTGVDLGLSSVIHRSPLWQNRDFVLFWGGQSVSLFGSQITQLALPLTAILVLHATPLQVGLLTAAQTSASLVLGLSAGVWVDRHHRRALMIASNIGRALILACIPLAAWLHVLALWHLYAATFLSFSLAVFFSAARQAYLPTIVPTSMLIEANAGLRVSAAGAQIAGPGLGGLLVQLLSPPIAILADALSFLVSAAGLAAIRADEAPLSHGEKGSMRQDMREGVGIIVHDPGLRSLIAASGSFNMFDSILLAVYLLYLSRTLHFAASAVGLLFGLAGAGGLIAALIVLPVTRRLGVGRAILWGIVLATVGESVIAAAAGPPIVAFLIVLLAEGSVELGAGLYGMNVSSLQLTLTPPALRGRVSATSDFVTTGVEAIGAILGGVLGQSVGLRETVLIAGGGTFLSLVWLLRSPIRHMRELPSHPGA